MCIYPFPNKITFIGCQELKSGSFGSCCSAHYRKVDVISFQTMTFLCTAFIFCSLAVYHSCWCIMEKKYSLHHLSKTWEQNTSEGRFTVRKEGEITDRVMLKPPTSPFSAVNCRILQCQMLCFESFCELFLWNIDLVTHLEIAITLVAIKTLSVMVAHCKVLLTMKWIYCFTPTVGSLRLCGHGMKTNWCIVGG